MMDPGNDIQQLSAGALSAMTNSAFGSIAGPVIDADLLDALGIGGSSSLAGYMSKINDALANIENQLGALQNSVAEILAGVTEIEERIDDVEVQAVLLAFSQNAGVITELFRTYSNAVAALGSSGSRSAGISDLFSLLTLNNAVKIATAMTAVQEAFLPTLMEQKGLIQLQPTVLRDTVSSAGTASDCWTARRDFPFVNGGLKGMYEGALVYNGMHAAARTALDGPVTDTLKAFLTISIQGLILLNAAWLNSTQEEQIRSQVTAIKRVLAGMIPIGDSVCQTIDDQVSLTLNSVGKRLIVASGTSWGHTVSDSTEDSPFGSEWIQWQAGPQTAWVQQSPWTYPDPSSANRATLVFVSSQDKIFINEPDDPPTIFPGRYQPLKDISKFFALLASLMQFLSCAPAAAGADRSA